MRGLSLRGRLLAVGGLLVFLSVLVTGLFSTWKAASALRETAEGAAVAQAMDSAMMVQSVISREVWVARGLASVDVVRSVALKVGRDGVESVQDQIAELNGELQTLISNLGKNYEGVFLTDASGIGYAGTTPDGKTEIYKGVKVSERSYFQEAKAKGEAVIGDPVISKVSNEPVIVVAVPIKNEDGSFQGILGLTVRIDFLIENLSKIKVGKSGYVFMADRNGLIISHPTKDLILKLDLDKTPGLEDLGRAMATGASGVVNYVFKGDKKIAGYAPVGINGWMIGATQLSSDFLEPVRRQVFGMLTIGFVALVATLLVFFVFSRRLTRPILEAVAGLREGSDQVAAAATQVSGAGQQLAEGASEQAASLEETSSALEEIASMSRQNAQNSSQADVIVKEALRDIGEAQRSMEILTGAMREIASASEETQKIIKTIDEIAFQTNLLALNAAVEAARAGEAGAGFAVVADEVRNLAVRAAEAAKNTAQLIENTVTKVRHGDGVLLQVNDAFAKVAQGTGRIGELVGEIAAASGEQADGVEQVNRAVAEMDKVVQRNAANAEESASAAEELNAQAEQMREYVRQLAVLVNGVGADGGSGVATGGQASKRDAALSSSKVGSGNGKACLSVTSAKKTAAPKPEELIPFDEDFKDF